MQLAAPVEVYSRRRGVDAALAIARRHRGTQFDPAIVDVFCDHAPELLDGLDQASEWDAVLDAEPELSRRVGGSDLDEVLEAMADLVDLKSPFLAGHSRGVANLVGEAARERPSRGSARVGVSLTRVSFEGAILLSDTLRLRLWRSTLVTHGSGNRSLLVGPRVSQYSQRTRILATPWRWLRAVI